MLFKIGLKKGSSNERICSLLQRYWEFFYLTEAFKIKYWHRFILLFLVAVHRELSRQSWTLLETFSSSSKTRLCRFVFDSFSCCVYWKKWPWCFSNGPKWYGLPPPKHWSHWTLEGKLKKRLFIHNCFQINCISIRPWKHKLTLVEQKPSACPILTASKLRILFNLLA